MKAHSIRSDIQGGLVAGENDSLNVVALCDGLIGGVYAHEAIAALGNACGAGTLLSSSYWSFEMLRRPTAEQLSMGIALRADLLVIAGFAEVPLPVSICAWLKKLYFNCEGNGPAIAVFYPELPEHHLTALPMCGFLRELAEASGARFVCNETFDEQIEQGLVGELLQHQRPLHPPPLSGRWVEQEWHFAG